LVDHSRGPLVIKHKHWHELTVKHYCKFSYYRHIKWHINSVPLYVHCSDGINAHLSRSWQYFLSCTQNFKQKYCHIRKRWWITNRYEMTIAIFNNKSVQKRQYSISCLTLRKLHLLFCFVYQSSLLLDWTVNKLPALNAHSAVETVLLNTLSLSHTYNWTFLFL
jgi:hypothetical protein